jgi:hypothetical protein
MRINLALLGFVCAACVADDSSVDDWSDPGKADDPTAGGVVATHAPEVRVLDGFHALLDTTSGPCLESTGTGPQFQIGAIEKLFELRFLKEKEDLAQTLGIDVGLKIKYGAASGAATASFLDNFKQTGSATHLLVSARASYRVTNRRPVKLTTDAAELLTSDPRAFLHRCGNFYVNGVEHEAQLFVMIRLDAQTEDAARTITADLGLQGGTTALGVDATVKGKLEQLAKREDVTVEVSVLDRGFLTDGGTTGVISSLLAGGLDAMTFDKIDGVRRSMLDSLNADACRDGGMGLAQCTGDRPGYAENAVRNAVPVRIDLRPYARATNAPVGGAGSPYETMRKLIDGANRHLRALSRNATRMDAIVNDEIGPFLDAPATRQATYGIAPPAAPVFTLDALIATASRFRDTFDPEHLGSPAAALHDEISRCWASTLEGGIDTCATPDAVPELPQMKATEAALADYTASGRVVPLRFSVDGVQRFEDAEASCASKARRLPTFDEAQRLAIAIGFAELPRTTETRLAFAAWHADRSMCTGGQFGTFSNIPGGAHGNLCTPDTFLAQHPVTTLCVPPGGPFD